MIIHNGIRQRTDIIHDDAYRRRKKNEEMEDDLHKEGLSGSDRD